MTSEIAGQRPNYKNASIPRKIGRALCDITLPTYITYPWRASVRHSYPREDHEDTRMYWGAVIPSWIQGLSEFFGVGFLASTPPGGSIRDAVIVLAAAHGASKAIEGTTHIIERTVWERDHRKKIRSSPSA